MYSLARHGADAHYCQAPHAWVHFEVVQETPKTRPEQLDSVRPRTQVAVCRPGSETTRRRMVSAETGLEDVWMNRPTARSSQNTLAGPNSVVGWRKVEVVRWAGGVAWLLRGWHVVGTWCVRGCRAPTAQTVTGCGGCFHMLSQAPTGRHGPLHPLCQCNIR